MIMNIDRKILRTRPRTGDHDQDKEQWFLPIQHYVKAQRLQKYLKVDPYIL